MPKSGGLGGLLPEQIFLRQRPLELRKTPICAIVCTCFIIDHHAEKEKLVRQPDLIEFLRCMKKRKRLGQAFCVQTILRAK